MATLFSVGTLKPLDKVFDRDLEKEKVKYLIEHGFAFSVSGLRRVGKTTLVRSVASAIEDVIPAYVNLWAYAPHEVSLEEFWRVLWREVEREIRKRKSLWRRFLSHVGGLRISFPGTFEVEVVFEKLSALCQMLEGTRLCLILDEAQELLRFNKKLLKAITGLYDQHSDKLSLVLMGSVSSVAKLLEVYRESSPLYGRLFEELVIEPFPEVTAKRFLEEGFAEEGIRVHSDVIELAVSKLNGYPGWLVEFGNKIVYYEKIGAQYSASLIVKEIARKAEDTLCGEIARILSGKRNVTAYLEILNLAAVLGSLTPSEAARSSRKIRHKSSAHRYLNVLVDYGLMKEREGEYYIPDPIVRRIASNKSFKSMVLQKMSAY